MDHKTEETTGASPYRDCTCGLREGPDNMDTERVPAADCPFHLDEMKTRVILDQMVEVDRLRGSIRLLPRDYIVPREQLARLLSCILNPDGDQEAYCLDPVGTVASVDSAIARLTVLADDAEAEVERADELAISLVAGRRDLVADLRRRSMASAKMMRDGDGTDARDGTSVRRESLRAQAKAYAHAADLAEAEL